VSFEEAITALADPAALTAPDLLHPDREITIGISALSRVLFVVHTESVFVGASESSALVRLQRTRGRDMRRTDSVRRHEGHSARYDWSKALRGKYAAKAAKASALLRILDPELAQRFPDSGSVNAALRGLLALERTLPRPRRRGGHAA